MLIELFGKNFGCFRDEFRLSMLATDIDRDSERGVVNVKVEGDPEPLRLLRCAAIYGANASGKTTVLEAAASLRHLIGESTIVGLKATEHYYRPFALGDIRGGPVELGARVLIGGHVYEYRVTYEKERIRSERLVCLDSNNEDVLIDRVDQKVRGLWMDDDRVRLITEDFRPHSLVLSLASQFSPTLAEPVSLGLTNSLIWWANADIHDDTIQPVFVIQQMVRDNEYATWTAKHLRRADVGTLDVRAQLAPRTPYSLGGYLVPADPQKTTGSSPDDLLNYELSFYHKSVEGAIPLTYADESAGTRHWLNLAPMLYELEQSNSEWAFFVDELDGSLHPTLLCEAVRRINARPADSIGPQVIFTAHETALIDGEAQSAILRRDQVYLTEKDETGAATLKSLVEFKERQVSNMRKRYLAGRYGAIPIVGD